MPGNVLNPLPGGCYYHRIFLDVCVLARNPSLYDSRLMLSLFRCLCDLFKAFSVLIYELSRRTCTLLFLSDPQRLVLRSCGITFRFRTILEVVLRTQQQFPLWVGNFAHFYDFCCDRRSW
uniref:Uncharacterized protein n=1 Tax=Tetraselmis sp. GSL018 TaxID=582737 RepID=A0A061RVS2_9CHLO